jgi:hypothetical protein
LPQLHSPDCRSGSASSSRGSSVRSVPALTRCSRTKAGRRRRWRAKQSNQRPRRSASGHMPAIAVRVPLRANSNATVQPQEHDATPALERHPRQVVQNRSAAFKSKRLLTMNGVNETRVAHLGARSPLRVARGGGVCRTCVSRRISRRRPHKEAGRTEPAARDCRETGSPANTRSCRCTNRAAQGQRTFDLQRTGTCTTGQTLPPFRLHSAAVAVPQAARIACGISRVIEHTISPSLGTNLRPVAILHQVSSHFG